MLINECSGTWNKGLMWFFIALLTCFSFFSQPASAVLIEGKINGVITGTYIDGEKPKTPFFDLAIEGQIFSADFWYEFDENNFQPTDKEDYLHSYDFGFSDMGVVVQMGGETLNSTAPSDFPLTHHRNLIEIHRNEQYDSFHLTTYNIHSAVNPMANHRSIDIILLGAAMAHFSNFDLVPNVLNETSDGFMGEVRIMDYGTVEDNKYPGELYDYDILLHAAITSVDVRVRRSTVDESGSLGLVLLGSLIIGWRYRRFAKYQLPLSRA